ncbi:MAG: hypothetical protein ACLT3D_05820 [Lawsonibacter sp.]
MRERRRGRDRLRVLRRGVGLGLALVTVWGVGLTADLSGVGRRCGRGPLTPRRWWVCWRSSWVRSRRRLPWRGWTAWAG